MSHPERRPRGVPNWAVALVGLAITVAWLSGYRPWGDGPANMVLLLGPLLLVAAAASQSAQSRPSQASGKKVARPAGRVVRNGLVMLLIGGCPWIYTPLTTGGELNQASGMLGTLIFLAIGVPGLVLTLIGLIHLFLQRRARAKAGPDPEV